MITDNRGIVLHMGRRRRLFTGAQRDAVLLAATRCTHPGCETASGDSQADHLQPHSHGGTTSTLNGAPACGTHNRWRYTHHARTVLDARGHWHTYRKDGTEVA
ncbi:MAG: HNH endonuclease [Actinobacteria bacterium]|nr:HNH endonuclease [Actinomycetota bacterium]